jgi:hypothetical protein
MSQRRMSHAGSRLPCILAAACAVAVLVVGCATSRPGPPPIPDRVIQLDGQCTQTEADGFRETARLRIADNRVQELSWQLWVGQRGGCRFDFAEFTQTRRRPAIELIARDGSGCKLMVWQDPAKVTLAHAGCERRCTPGIYEDAWPVMFDAATGRCTR